MKKQSEYRTYDSKTVREIMKAVAKREGLDLVFMKAREGMGGYNYGGSAGDCVMLAPFKKGRRGDKIGKYELDEDCDNPLECMFITFFHELAHCRLAEDVPHNLKGYSWNDTSRFQYELWITMLGVEYAYKNWGVKFSDQAVRWILHENMSYIRDDWKDFGYSLTVKKPTSRSYSVIGLPPEIFS